MAHYPVLAKNHTVAYVGTYPPTECGIATFTMDVLNATDLAGWRSVVVAVEDTADKATKYCDSKVVCILNKENRTDYRKVAQILEDRGVSLVSIQHEYGIYGGDCGEYIIDLARYASMPVLVTLHTVLPNPTDKQRTIIKELEKHVAGFVVMANKAVELLRDYYGIASSKIHVVPHGAPNAPFDSAGPAKAELGLTGQRVISTFGLISPSKGIEDAISAMPAIVDKVPDAVYLIMGQTHPVVKRREGEWYRDQLVQQVHQLGLDKNVKFIDQYLSLQQLIQYLLATDVYVTPYYANPFQITSGTLAYAVAVGKVVVSTPYFYAEELLAEGRGFLYPFRDIAYLSKCISHVLTNDELFNTTRNNAYAYGRNMTWQSVGLQYTRLFTETLDERWINHRAAVDTVSIPGLAELLKDGDVWASKQSANNMESTSVALN